MTDPCHAKSGFDAEILIGERYISYLLLSLTETGSLPLQFEFEGDKLTALLPSDIDRSSPTLTHSGRIYAKAVRSKFSCSSTTTPEPTSRSP
jgi:hypothetical protein